MIPVTVVVVTKDAAGPLPRCLDNLSDFPVIIVDSHSIDGTRDVAQDYGAVVVDFAWNGAYPKKRQWCLENLTLPYPWVFFVDADEVVTTKLAREIADLFRGGNPPCAGYFVRGRYMDEGRALHYGLHNNKLALFDSRMFAFPLIDDIGLPMGEIEGHYQPQPKIPGTKIGQLQGHVLHYAAEDRARWMERHERYAQWEAGMNRRRAWPQDPVKAREFMKRFFRAMPFRAEAAFLHSLIMCGGIRNGPAGWRQARDRYIYYRMVARAARNYDGL